MDVLMHNLILHCHMKMVKDRKGFRKRLLLVSKIVSDVCFRDWDRLKVIR